MNIKNNQDKTFKAKVQVNNSLERYFPSKIKDMEVFYNMFYQINDVLLKNPKKVLIIGIGNGLEKCYFEKKGIEVKTIDIDPVLKPDYLCSLTDIDELNFKSKEFDVILASHVLEHIPFKYIDNILKKFSEISKYSVIHLPFAQARFGIRFNIWLLGEFGFNIDIPIFSFKKHKFNGEHYWEPGTRSYSKNFLRNFFSKYFIIEREYQNKYNVYSYNYILKSKT